MSDDRTVPDTQSPTLFPLPEPVARERLTSAEGAKVDPKPSARIREANRSQTAWGRIDLDAQLAEEHVARAIWAVVERLDLSALYGQIKARGEEAGAPAIDPKIVLALWVYATSEGEGSGREIARLTEAHDAYRWLRGGVDVGYHTLTDFRAEQGSVFDKLITQVLALLMKQELVDLSRVAQDGSRVRASAGASSFRREKTLEGLMQQARAHLEAVTREALDPAITARRAAARKRGAPDFAPAVLRKLESKP